MRCRWSLAALLGCSMLGTGYSQNALDFSGVYAVGPRVLPCDLQELSEGGNDRCVMISLTPEGEASMKAYDPYSDDPRQAGCAPENMPRILFSGGDDTMRIIQERETITILYERGDTTRTIHLGGNPPPSDHPRTPLGYSVGRWLGTGDTLVIETAHLAEGIFTLDGHPLSAQALITERYQRTVDGSLRVEVAIDDPVNYAEPVILEREWVRAPDDAVLPWDCVPL